MIIVGVTKAAADNCVLPTYQIGDLLLLAAWRQTAGGMIAPTAGGTVPPWRIINSQGTPAPGIMLYWWIPTVLGLTSGVWTYSTQIIIICLRANEPTRYRLGPGVNLYGTGTAASIVYPAITIPSGRRGGLGGAIRVGARATLPVTEVANPPTDWTNQAVQPAGASAVMAMHTRLGLSLSPVADTVPMPSSAAYRAITQEINEAVIPASIA